MDSPSQIQFFSKDMCAPIGKVSAYIHYISHAIDKEPFNAFARRTDFNTLNEEIIINGLKNKIKSISSVSMLSRYYKIIDDIRELYPDSTIKYIPRLVPKYQINTYNMCGGINESKLDRLIVWEMNKVAPEITGYYFEIMLARILEVYKCVESNNILRGRNDVILIEDFNKMIKRHKIDKNEILYGAIMAYLERNDLTEKVFNEIIDLTNCVKVLSKDLEEYENMLKDSHIVQTMMKEPLLRHSVYMKDEETGLMGEADFISNSYITDCKCYKVDDFKSWASQVYLYRKLSKNDTLKLRIINFNTNSVHEFVILKDGESIDEDEEETEEGS